MFLHPRLRKGVQRRKAPFVETGETDSTPKAAMVVLGHGDACRPLARRLLFSAQIRNQVSETQRARRSHLPARRSGRECRQLEVSIDSHQPSARAGESPWS